MKKQDENTQEGKSLDSISRDLLRACKENASMAKKKKDTNAGLPNEIKKADDF